jgi:hypothetical protein
VLRHRQAGAASREQLILGAIVALFCAALVAVFRQSVTWGFIIVGTSLAAGLLVLVFGYFHTVREERRRGEACKADLERAAAEQGAAIEAVFSGRGEGGYAAFGVAGAARKLLHARESYQKDRVSVFDFDQLTSAFARPDGKDRFRLEIRARLGDSPSQRAARFVTVEQREEAGRWVEVLKPHLGDKARFVESESDLPKESRESGIGKRESGKESRKSLSGSPPPRE